MVKDGNDPRAGDGHWITINCLNIFALPSSGTNALGHKNYLMNSHLTNF